MLLRPRCYYVPGSSGDKRSGILMSCNFMVNNSVRHLYVLYFQRSLTNYSMLSRTTTVVSLNVFYYEKRQFIMFDITHRLNMISEKCV